MQCGFSDPIVARGSLADAREDCRFDGNISRMKDTQRISVEDAYV